MTSGGDGCCDISDEQRTKISNSLKGKKQSQKTIDKRKDSLKLVWQNEKLRDIKRKQTKKLNELGIIGTKGKPSNKKGKKISSEIKNKISKTLKEYFCKNKPHNFILIDEYIKNKILQDYKNGVSQFQLHKTYGFSRSVIKRLIKEYENY